jgi:magnesium-protoporphyrin IX monomethyl ester (oxidative) cyclase
MNAPVVTEFPATACDVTSRAVKTTTLAPRFYTTDVAAMNRLSADAVRGEWDALMAEFAADENRGHFARGNNWQFDLEGLPVELREELLDFMVSSLTAEFSGCLLYAELKRKGVNADLKALFKYMARDEARHAGFINDCLRDLGVKVDMGGLAKSKKYTYFSPKFILYATYLSEKIGYARYIKVFRQLEQRPELRFHPIFSKFERWCQDEYRHGEALAMVLRANPKLLRGPINRLWMRFFQVAVYATMFVRDHQRPHFHRALGLDIERYDMDVFRIVDDVAHQVFPVRMDIDHPAFLRSLKRLRGIAERIEAARRRGGVLGWLRRGALSLYAGAAFARMLFLPTKTHELPDALRVAPTW